MKKNLSPVGKRKLKWIMENGKPNSSPQCETSALLTTQWGPTELHQKVAMTLSMALTSSHSCKQCNKRAGKSWEANVSAKLMILNPVQCFALPTGPRALGDIFAEICFFLDDYYLQCL